MSTLSFLSIVQVVIIMHGGDDRIIKIELANIRPPAILTPTQLAVLLLFKAKTTTTVAFCQ